MPPDPASPVPATGRTAVLFSLGFRPFFLLAAAAAPALMLAWLGSWHGEVEAETYYGRAGWHAHEMLFGYLVAVVAGFLLTAVRNWTGRQTAGGARLAALAGLWLSGRLLCWWSAVPAPLVALADLLFLPALAATLAGPLWAHDNRVNRGFVALLLAMSVANALVHGEALGLLDGGARAGVGLMLDLVMLLLIWVSGRVVPFFLRVALAGADRPAAPRLEQLGMVLAMAVAMAHLVPAARPVAAVMLTLLALQQAWRSWRWHDHRIWSIPILWILYCGQLWLLAAIALRAAAGFDAVPVSVAVHALTVGAFGGFTLGMMARVALGHTGRPMRSHPALNLGFVLFLAVYLPVLLGPGLDAEG